MTRIDGFEITDKVFLSQHSTEGMRVLHLQMSSFSINVSLSHKILSPHPVHICQFWAQTSPHLFTYVTPVQTCTLV